MGFLTKSRDGQDLEFQDENSGATSGANLEKLYEKLFPKIGRDFLFKEDFQRIISELIEAINPELMNEIDFYSMGESINRAVEYRDFIDQGIDGSTIYEDLIDLSDD